VSVEIGVSIGSDTVMLPAPVKVIAGVPDEASKALPEVSNVNVPAVLPTVAAVLRVTELVTVLVFAKLSSAPLPEPLPPIVNGSAIERPEPSKCTAPVLATSVTPSVVPSAKFLATLNTPAVTLVVPVYVLSLEPDNLSVLAPDFASTPAPEITPEIVCVVPAVAFENDNVLADDVMTMFPAYDALVPSVPDTARLPPSAAIVVLPEYVLAPDNVRVVEAPALMMLPVPVIDPLKPVVPADPEVSVADPSEIVPAPVIEPTVSDTSFMLNVPVTDTADASGMLPEPESRNSPSVTVVPPL
jgi:hypothetical protein